MPLEQLNAWARSADVVYAADGGGDRLLEAGVPPDTTIGDLDSIRSVLPFRRLIQDPDQETSDCDKLLTLTERSGHNRITLIGLEGDRLDHVLATLGSAVRSLLDVRLALRSGLGYILRGPAQQSFATSPGETASLMPLSPCTGVSFSGVEWPLENDELGLTAFVSLSNKSLGSTVDVRLETGAAALFFYSEDRRLPSW
ncbi:thiamine pyrophosphokinase [Fimbriimonas ginsengisoli Gsoil 348]|uniref:Thiamine diphosphokinase n=2 Tax=Fimbriimonas ginsengisoli TaxID=1005039 RepID=A0A068NXD2_FIMGI|nr:thiamine pyrophosphokinase [Fimbriimonas ginsengisoli Gsoil 348]